MRRLYRRTEAGRKAWDTQSIRVELEYRRVLGFVGEYTDPRELAGRLGWSAAAIEEMLKDLEQRGMVKSIDGGDPDRTDLDFTGPLALGELRGARNKS